MKVDINATSLDVLKDIISKYPDIDSVKLILHGVSINWRQRYTTDGQKLSHLEESLLQKIPIKVKVLSREEFLSLDQGKLETDDKHQVWSFTSKMTMKDGDFMHLPMMNFHPHDDISVEDIINFVKIAFPDKSGVILESGRYFHYYGNFLMSEHEWVIFNAKFLMPCVFVSPRYVGHVLQDGYSSLRFTCDDKYKPVIPSVVHTIKK
jgi:hypothetical protein